MIARKARKQALLLLFCFSLSLAPAAQTIPVAPAIDTEIREVMARIHVKGLALAVIDHGQVGYAQAYGIRNAAGDPLTTDTIMYGASLTKTLFAYTVMQIVDQGRLKLDTSIAADLNRPLPSGIRTSASALESSSSRGPKGRCYFKGGHDGMTANTLVCLEPSQRCVLVLSIDVRAELGFPSSSASSSETPEFPATGSTATRQEVLMWCRIPAHGSYAPGPCVLQALSCVSSVTYTTHYGLLS